MSAGEWLARQFIVAVVFQRVALSGGGCDGLL